MVACQKVNYFAKRACFVQSQDFKQENPRGAKPTQSNGPSDPGEQFDTQILCHYSVSRQGYFAEKFL
jgi:hypothetical protein